MSEVSTKRLRAATGIIAVIGLGSLVWFQAGDSLSQMARRVLANFSDGSEITSEKSAILFVQDSAGNIVVEVRGLDSQVIEQLKKKNLSNTDWAQILSVYTGDHIPADLTATPAMLGTYAIEKNVIRFTPRFPLVAGLDYTAQFSMSEGVRLHASYRMPKVEYSNATFITNIYPSSDVLPANQLKLYIHFSAPMSMGEAYDHIRLLDDKGRQIEKAFLRLEEELWDQDRRRLTLWFDPGRIKRGLRPNAEMGAPLEEGKQYNLVIEPSWRDENGNPLRERFEKRFQTTRADRTAPDYKEWKLISPEGRSSEPVTIMFSEAMDHALMESFIEVIDANGNRVPGRAAIAEGETEWRFTPNSLWNDGAYKIYINPKLEDRAGNSLDHLFDTDVRKGSQVSSATQRIELSFDVKVSAGR